MKKPLLLPSLLAQLTINAVHVGLSVAKPSLLIGTNAPVSLLSKALGLSGIALASRVLIVGIGLISDKQKQINDANPFDAGDSIQYWPTVIVSFVAEMLSLYIVSKK